MGDFRDGDVRHVAYVFWMAWRTGSKAPAVSL